MEQQPDTTTAYEKALRTEEKAFVHTTLKTASEAMATLQRFELDDVQWTDGKWAIRGERAIGDTGRCEFSLTLSDERQPDREEDAFVRPRDEEFSIQYELERIIWEDVLFEKLTRAEQLALIDAFERDVGNYGQPDADPDDNKNSEDGDVEVKDEDGDYGDPEYDEFLESDTLLAMKATVEGRPAPHVECERVRRTRFECGQFAGSLEIREERDEIAIKDDFHFSKVLVDELYDYVGADCYGYDLIRMITVDDPAMIEVKADPISQATHDDLTVMKEILLYVGLPCDDYVPDETDPAGEILNQLDAEMHIDLTKWRWTYGQAFQPSLDRLNMLAGDSDSGELPPHVQAEIDATLHQLNRALENHRKDYADAQPAVGDHLLYTGNQMVQSLDEQGDVDGLTTVYGGSIGGIFKRVAITSRYKDEFLEHDQTEMTDDERYSLDQKYGLCVVLSDTSVADRFGNISHRDGELYLPLQQHYSDIHTYEAGVDLRG